MTQPPTIVVAGLGRCGSSLTMQMLAAGGIPCVGQFPAFEDDRVKHQVTREAIESWRGLAVKILDPHRVGLPGDVRVIWCARDPVQQARSHAKFAAATAGLRYTRDQRRRLEASLVRDTRTCLRLIAPRPALVLGFQQLVLEPAKTARRIAEFIAGMPFDPIKAAEVVRPRAPQCAPDLSMELALLGETA